MSKYAMESMVDPSNLDPRTFETELTQNCLMPMGLTSENVAEKFGVTR